VGRAKLLILPGFFILNGEAVGFEPLGLAEWQYDVLNLTRRSECIFNLGNAENVPGPN
jgi:hypothetical protein